MVFPGCFVQLEYPEVFCRAFTNESMAIEGPHIDRGPEVVRWKPLVRRLFFWPRYDAHVNLVGLLEVIAFRSKQKCSY